MLSLESKLKYSSLGLLPVLDIEILNQVYPNETQRHDTRTCSQHPGLGVSVGTLDGDTHCTALRIRKLHVKALINTQGISLGRFWEVLEKGAVEGVGPDRTRNGRADCIAYRSEDEEHGYSSGHILMLYRSQAGKLRNQDKDSTAYRDENLAHDKIAHAGAWSPEVDHEALSKDV